MVRSTIPTFFLSSLCLRVVCGRWEGTQVPQHFHLPICTGCIPYGYVNHQPFFFFFFPSSLMFYLVACVTYYAVPSVCTMHIPVVCPALLASSTSRSIASSRIVIIAAIAITVGHRRHQVSNWDDAVVSVDIWPNAWAPFPRTLVAPVRKLSCAITPSSNAHEAKKALIPIQGREKKKKKRKKKKSLSSC
ncbi:uncharacterized protein LY79DRAFT_64272 [Colletotrichum navitas]|uniref:Secreted protein n=1 Tax=Colletotrichum navitas TaxID=681940 RepID=A0AAD8Q6W9_9PEZI|nr:uncharacterized protein LY79DRAFT_64272 [Colletotrichum navitas]KAK1596411.1 hypothetical protein LY79DRAFT_64272 [Colletotrichum navitas]